MYDDVTHVYRVYARVRTTVTNSEYIRGIHRTHTSTIY